MSEIAPKVTVYIVSHNYGQYLEHAIESVLRQSMDDWELYIIDDKSADNTREIMQCYSEIGKITLLEGEGRGLIPIANTILQVASGKYIIRLDADDVFDENILLVLSNYLDRNDDTALVFPDYYLMDETGVSYSSIRKESLSGNDNVQDAPPHGACTMMRKSVLDEVGGYDESLKAQDGFYIWSKIRGRYGVRNVNLPLFYYRQHGTNLTRNSARITMARQEIKKLACDDISTCDMSIVAVIPCRQHYDFTPNLWNEKIGDMSALEHALSKCTRSEIFSKIVVTSDTDDVLECMKQFDDERIVFIPRDHKSTFRSKPMTDTLEKVSKELDLPDQAVMLLCYPQAPFTTPATLEEAVYTVLMYEADSAFTAVPMEEPLYRRGANGMTCINPANFTTSDFNTVFKESRIVFALKVSNLKRGSITGSKSICFSVDNDEQLYVNSAQDLILARSVVEE